MKKGLSLSILFAAMLVPNSAAQSAKEHSYPDLIIHNGKIVTVDNEDFSADPGTIAEAMAVRGDKILALGSNSEILALAGPETKKFDLKGRTVLPGLIDTHEHPQDWAPNSPKSYAKVVTDNDVVSRYLSGPPEEQFARLEATLREAVSKAKPGQWVRIYMFRGKMKEYSRQLVRELPRRISKSRLDAIAPDNPVQVKGAQNTVVNSLAIEEFKKVNPSFSGIDPKEKTAVLELGVGGPDFYRQLEAGVIFKGKLPLLAKFYRKELEFWASLGMTSFGSAQESADALRAYRYLDERGELPIRHGWAYRGPDFSPEILDFLASMVGHGTDRLWFIGAMPSSGGTCTTIDARPEVKRREDCSFEPGSPDAVNMYNIIKSGLRVAGMHTWGDKDIDYYLDIIEKASKDASFTLEEVRAKRHTFDHAALAPRPDQYERIKKLGMIVSASSSFNYWYTPELVENYGEKYAAWCVPRKSLSDYGIMNTFEVDTPLSQESTTIFEVAAHDLTRRARDGKVHGASERIDRVRELKALTTWGSYYLLKENLIGSLEPGKFADFIVIDRDYLTVPEEEIGKIKVLLTAVGGKIVYLAPSLAAELRLTPIGYGEEE